MNETLSIINFTEARYFYQNPLGCIDYTQMRSFNIIKSCLEIFAFYGVRDFFPSDIHDFFAELQLVQKSTGKVFVPSAKKAEGVLEYCQGSSDCCISKNSDGSYHIDKWNTVGYKAEIELAYQRGHIKETGSME